MKWLVSELCNFSIGDYETQSHKLIILDHDIIKDISHFQSMQVYAHQSKLLSNDAQGN